MKRLCVCDIVGVRHGQPNAEHELTRENHRKYAESVGADYRAEVIEIGDDLRCCWWKWRAADVAAEYDVTLHLDNDTIVTAKCPSFADVVPAGHWGVVDEYYRLRKDCREFIAQCANTTEPELGLSTNNGVLIMPSDAKQIYFPDYESASLNWLTDQTLLSRKFYRGEAQYRAIDRRWNWSFMSHVDFIAGRDQAFIIHHAGRSFWETPAKKLQAIERDLRELGL